MHRFFRECFSDPALAAMLGIAFLLAAGMAFAILRQRLKVRRIQQRHKRLRQEAAERNRKGA